MDTISEEDVFMCPETRDKIRHSVYELRLSAMTEMFKSKIAEVDSRKRQILDSIPEQVKYAKVSSFK